MPATAHPLVSVIIPVYNVEKYLPRCLDSVIAQTEKNLEIICVDDGSTDSSGAILAEYAAKDPRMRVVEKENGGLSSARNAGLDAFRGEWVTFVDSDDWIPRDAVECFERAALESGESLVISREYAVDSFEPRRANRAEWKRCAPALAKIVGRRKMQSCAWNKFYRADIVRDRRFIDGIYFEDWPFVVEIAGSLGSFALLDAPMYVYCKNGGDASIVRSPFGEKKARSYIAGIERVAGLFAARRERKYAGARTSAAAGTLISKVYRVRSPELDRLVVTELRRIRENHPFALDRLELKDRFRLWRMEKRAKA